MADIVIRLKDHYAAKDTDAWMICVEAANEITRLRNDVALLKTMLPPGYKYEVFRIGKGLVDD